MMPVFETKCADRWFLEELFDSWNGSCRNYPETPEPTTNYSAGISRDYHNVLARLSVSEVPLVGSTSLFDLT